MNHDDEMIQSDNSCDGFKHCQDKTCTYDDPKCKECVDDAYKAMKIERYRNLDLNEKVTDVLIEVAKAAYQEGREHQNDENFPEVGWSWTKKFEDTKIYKTIMEEKP